MPNLLIWIHSIAIYKPHPGEPGNEINSNKLLRNKNKKTHPNISCFTYDNNTVLVSIHSYPA